MSNQQPDRQSSRWVRDKKTKAIVGYITPDGQLVRLANAAVLYQRWMGAERERERVEIFGRSER